MSRNGIVSADIRFPFLREGGASCRNITDNCSWSGRRPVCNCNYEDAPNEEGVIVYHLHVAADDMGRVIGKQGRIARAIRIIMRSGAAKSNQKIAVEID